MTPAQKVAPSELVMCGVADLSPGHNRGRAVALAVVCPVDARNDFPPSLHLVLDGVGGYAVSALYQADFLSAAAAVTPDHHHSDSASGASGGLVSSRRDGEKDLTSSSSVNKNNNSNSNSSRSGYASSTVVVVVQHPEVVDVCVPRSALLRPPPSPLSNNSQGGVSSGSSSFGTAEGSAVGEASHGYCEGGEQEVVYSYRCVQIRDGRSVLVHGKPLQCADKDNHLKLQLTAFDR